MLTFGHPPSLNGSRLTEPGTDQSLLARIRSGDEAAFEALFRDTYARLVRAAQVLLGDGGLAEEVVQEVLLELWRTRERLVLETTLGAYLFRAVRNRALNQLRHDRIVRRSAPLLHADPATPAGEARLIEAEMDLAVRRGIEALPPRCREVFELSRIHHLRYHEIAETLGISIKTVEAQMGKAMRELREALGPWLTPRA